MNKKVEKELNQIRKDLGMIEDKINEQQKIINCLTNTGHTYKYITRKTQYYFCNKTHWVYFFKCACGYTKTYVWKNLTVKQQNALKILGINDKR